MSRLWTSAWRDVADNKNPQLQIGFVLLFYLFQCAEVVSRPLVVRLAGCRPDLSRFWSGLQNWLCSFLYLFLCAEVVELADTLALGASALRH
jgi:hypothetical protein